MHRYMSLSVGRPGTESGYTPIAEGQLPRRFIENAKAKIEEGFTAFKTGIPGPVDPVPDNQFIENFSNYIGAICDGLPKELYS